MKLPIKVGDIRRRTHPEGGSNCVYLDEITPEYILDSDNLKYDPVTFESPEGFKLEDYRNQIPLGSLSEYLALDEGVYQLPNQNLVIRGRGTCDIGIKPWRKVMIKTYPVEGVYDAPRTD